MGTGRQRYTFSGRKLGHTVPITFRVPEVVVEMIEEQVEADPNLKNTSAAMQDAVSVWLMMEQAADGEA